MLAHARRLRAIAEANYKRDDIDAELLARMREPPTRIGDHESVIALPQQLA